SARRAFSRVEDHDRSMREFAADALAMQEAESRRIARELHDGAGSALTAARLHLQALKDYASRLDASAASTNGTAMAADDARERARWKESILATSRLLDQAMDEVRRSAAALGPTSLDELGLPEALRRHCDDLSAANQIAVRFHQRPRAEADAPV